MLLHSLYAFVSFSAIASAVYILNDYLDIEEDRKHPKKKYRPLASGKVSKVKAKFTFILLIVFGGGLMYNQAKEALVVLLAYIVINIAYCFSLKHIAIIDITSIAIGFVLRLFIGSLVNDVLLSKWIVIMTFLLALFLALAKRRDDVMHFINTGKKMRKVIDGYNLKFIDSCMMVMASVVIVAYIIYTATAEVFGGHTHSEHLYLTSVFVIIGVMRYMQITFVEQNSGSPTEILLSDKFTVMNMLSWIVSFVYIIYLEV